MAPGAGEGNRTLVISLEGCCSTIELHPRRGPFTRLRHPLADGGGGGWTRTNEAESSGFTVRPLCHSGHSPITSNNENRGLNPATGWRYCFPPVCVRTSEKIPPNKGVAADRGLLSISPPMSSDLNPQKRWILCRRLYPFGHFFISAPCAPIVRAALSGQKPRKTAEKLKKPRPSLCR